MIDGEPVGQSPLRKLEIEAGEHSLDVYLPGYEQVRQTVRIEGGEELKLKLRLQKARSKMSRLSLTSTPRGASAYLGSVKIGKTPIKGILFKPGRAVLRLVLEGYPPYEVPVSLKAREHLSHHADLKIGPPTREGLLLELGGE